MSDLFQVIREFKLNEFESTGFHCNWFLYNCRIYRMKNINIWVYVRQLILKNLCLLWKALCLNFDCLPANIILMQMWSCYAAYSSLCSVLLLVYISQLETSIGCMCKWESRKLEAKWRYHFLCASCLKKLLPQSLLIMWFTI